MAGPRIRRLRDGDVDRAVALTDLESWGYSPADIRRFLALSKKGCFAAEVRREVVGVLATFAYGRVAYLGSVIVDPAQRGRGIGDAMMRAALTHLSASGVETVRLNAYVDVVPFYERLGFVKEYDNVRWEGGRVELAAEVVRPARRGDLERIVAFDEAYFGARRDSLLRRLHEEFPRTFLVSEERGEVLGFLVGNTSAVATEIGPWIVNPDRPDAGRALFGGLLATTDRVAFAFSGPEPNPRPHAFAREIGYREGFRSVRMVRGPSASEGRPEGVWSFAGLEKG